MMLQFQLMTADGFFAFPNMIMWLSKHLCSAVELLVYCFWMDSLEVLESYNKNIRIFRITGTHFFMIFSSCWVTSITSTHKFSESSDITFYIQFPRYSTYILHQDHRTLNYTKLLWTITDFDFSRKQSSQIPISTLNSLQ